jgi:hypothetical protein
LLVAMSRSGILAWRNSAYAALARLLTSDW